MFANVCITLTALWGSNLLKKEHFTCCRRVFGKPDLRIVSKYDHFTLVKKLFFVYLGLVAINIDDFVDKLFAYQK